MSRVCKTIIFRLRWLKQLLLRGGIVAMLSRKHRLFFLKSQRNFGDVLNEDIMSYLGIDYVRSPALFADTVCIGSLLDTLLLREDEKPYMPTAHVFGTGFMHPAKSASETFNRSLEIHALRGELSKRRCEKILGTKLDVPLGDPGLLISRVFPLKKKIVAQYDVGIVLHMSDAKAPLDNIGLGNLKVRYIDIRQDTKSFVDDIRQCRFILSSAMHGLICADSLGIPNKHIIVSDNVLGGSYKFEDYYSVFSNAKHHPVDIRKTVITEKQISEFEKAYCISPDEVQHICDRLELAAHGLKGGA